jgi:hypothetical protein
MIEALPLVGARAAWAVGVRLLQPTPTPGDVPVALAAALELTLGASAGLAVRVPPPADPAGEPARIMALADMVKDTAEGVLAAFECIQRCLFAQRVPLDRDRYLFDSKYFCATSGGGVKETLCITAARYAVTLQVQPDDLEDQDQSELRRRVSEMRVKPGRSKRLLRKRSG